MVSTTNSNPKYDGAVCLRCRTHYPKTKEGTACPLHGEDHKCNSAKCGGKHPKPTDKTQSGDNCSHEPRIVRSYANGQPITDPEKRAERRRADPQVGGA